MEWEVLGFMIRIFIGAILFWVMEYELMGEDVWVGAGMRCNMQYVIVLVHWFPMKSYLGPSFSNILGPCSCHSCFDIHMLSLSAICKIVSGMAL